jgi:hypothetical protein
MHAVPSYPLTCKLLYCGTKCGGSCLPPQALLVLLLHWMLCNALLTSLPKVCCLWRQHVVQYNQVQVRPWAQWVC